MAEKQSELTVITKVKELCTYTVTVTQRSPKQFRFTFVTRMQGMALDAIEQLYRANDTYIAAGDISALPKRLAHQHEALTSIRLLDYFAMLAMEQGCILPKQYEQIARLCTDCERLIGAWINSDKRRSRL